MLKDHFEVTKYPHPFSRFPAGDYRFRFDGHSFVCVFSPNHDCPDDMSLAGFLSLLDVIVDDDTQFARIIRFCDNIVYTLTYRSYNRFLVSININHSNIS